LVAAFLAVGLVFFGVVDGDGLAGEEVGVVQGFELQDSARVVLGVGYGGNVNATVGTDEEFGNFVAKFVSYKLVLIGDIDCELATWVGNGLGAVLSAKGALAGADLDLAWINVTLEGDVDIAAMAAAVMPQQSSPFSKMVSILFEFA